MNLIKISENVLVNPDKISAVIIRDNGVESGRTMFIVVDTLEYVVTVKPMDLLQELIKTGMEVENLTWQYWSG